MKIKGKTNCILVGTRDDGSPVHLVVSPEDPSFDGIVVNDDGDNILVPFWSYVSREPVNPLLETAFHKRLWSGEPDEEWNKKFMSREEPLSLGDLGDAKGYVVTVGPGPAEDREPATKQLPKDGDRDGWIDEGKPTERFVGISAVADVVDPPNTPAPAPLTGKPSPVMRSQETGGASPGVPMPKWLTEAVAAKAGKAEKPKKTKPGFKKGPKAAKGFKEVVKVQKGTKGRAKERSEALERVVGILDGLHGLPDSMMETEVKLGPKAQYLGGKFVFGSRGPVPKRTKNMSSAEWYAKVAEYNSRPERNWMQVNDADISSQMHTLAHELGHGVDFIGGKRFHSRDAWSSPEANKLRSKYGKDWLEHVDEVQDETTRLFLQLAKEARSAKSIKDYLDKNNAKAKYREYFTDIAEIWARAYAQWVVQTSEDPDLMADLAEKQKKNFQFSDEEFSRIGPLIEAILKARGLME